MSTEKSKANELVIEVLNRGFTVSVWDGEEWTLKKSRDRKAIVGALNTTGEDILRVQDNTSKKIGWFALIWGNAANGEELVSDYTCNDICNDIWNKVFGGE